MKRKLLFTAAVLIACLSAASCGEKKDSASNESYSFNETGYPVVNEPITLTVAAKKNAIHGNWDETYWYKYALEKTNINLEFDYIDSTAWEQKKQLMFAADELPDVIIGGYYGITRSDEMAYGEGGLLISLNDLIDKYAVNLKKLYGEQPLVKADTTTPDGNIYTLPTARKVKDVVGGVRIWTNETWLKNLGLSKPETVAQMREVLYKFRDGDPDGDGQNNTYAISGVFDDVEGDMRYLYHNAFGMLSSGVYVDNGKVVYGAMQPNFKEYLKEMNYLYSEGLIDKEYFTQTIAEYKAKSSTGKVGIGTWSAPAAGGGMDIDTSEQYGFTKALTSDYNSITMWSMGEENCSSGHFAITKACKYPEAAIRWADLWYSEEGGIVFDIGPNVDEADISPKIGYKINEDGTWTSFDETGAEDGWASFNKYVSPVADGCAFGLYPEFVSRKKDATVGKFYEALKSNDDYYANGKAHGICALPNSFYFSQEERESLALIETEVTEYCSQMEAKFIAGSEPIENFDKFVENLRGYGVETLIEYYQKAYDDYLKKIE